jgi:tetratricopeptide (TPR) repeat protein
MAKHIYTNCGQNTYRKKGKIKMNRMIMLFWALIIFMCILIHTSQAELVGYWKFDEVNSKNAKDYSGHDFDGTLRGDACMVEDAERGGVLQVSGAGYVNCGNHAAFNITRELTLAAWIKLDKPSIWGKIISKPYNTIGWDPPYAAYCIGMNSSEQTPQGYMYICSGRPEVITRQIIPPGEWHHISFVVRKTEPEKNVFEIYIDGVLQTSQEYIGVELGGHDPDTCLYIGSRREDLNETFSGYIDEVTVFSHSLSQKEVEILYQQGHVSFLPEPLQEIYISMQKAQSMIEKGKHQEVIPYLSKTIERYEKWKIENPDVFKTYIHHIFADIYFLLAQVKEETDTPKEEIVSLYKRGIEPGWLTRSNQGPVLSWLNSHVTSKEYEDIIASLLEHNNDYLAGISEYAKDMIQRQQEERAVRFLEDNLAAYDHWREKHPYHEVVVDCRLPLAYYLLAQARLAAGTSETEQTQAYQNTCQIPVENYIKEQSQAFLWLLKNQHADEYTEIIRAFTRSKSDHSVCKEIIQNISQTLEEQKNWEAFQMFLDELFTQTEEPFKWAVFVESCLQDSTNRWGRQYFSYLEEKPEIRFGRDWEMAKQYAAEGNFEQAAALYQDLLKRSSEKGNRGELAFERCKSLFYAGHYEEALTEMESFILTYKGSHRNLVIETMLMQSNAYVQLDKLNKAIDVFYTMMTEFPEVKEMPQISFLMGYCYMMQNKNEAAAEAFQIVTQLYPNSDYSGKARLCLLRLHDTQEGVQ